MIVLDVFVCINKKEYSFKVNSRGNFGADDVIRAINSGAAGDLRGGEDPGAAEQGDRRQAAAHEGGPQPPPGAHQQAPPREVSRQRTTEVCSNDNLLFLNAVTSPDTCRLVQCLFFSLH